MDTGHGLDGNRQKRGGRECRPSTRGRMRRGCWRPSDTTLFNQSAVPWASFTNCQKKGCSLSTQMTTLGSATGRSVVSSTEATTHPSCVELKVTSLPTAALCSHGVELLPILQNLSIDVHQNIVCFLNKLFPTPFVRHPSSCIHQSDVLIFKRHNLQAVD